MRRREAQRLREEGAIAPPPIAASDPRVPAGHCPKCGQHVGRAVRAHAKDCAGVPDLPELAPEAPPAEKGVCPKCGRRIGRGIGFHVKRCRGRTG